MREEQTLYFCCCFCAPLFLMKYFSLVLPHVLLPCSHDQILSYLLFLFFVENTQGQMAFGMVKKVPLTLGNWGIGTTKFGEPLSLDSPSSRIISLLSSLFRMFVFIPPFCSLMFYFFTSSFFCSSSSSLAPSSPTLWSSLFSFDFNLLC